MSAGLKRIQKHVPFWVQSKRFAALFSNFEHRGEPSQQLTSHFYMAATILLHSLYTQLHCCVLPAC